jgi:hypothetical protein
MHLANERFQPWHAGIGEFRTLPLAMAIAFGRKSCAAKFAEWRHCRLLALFMDAPE